MKRLKKLIAFSMLVMFVLVICGAQLVSVSANDGKQRLHSKDMAFELGYFKPSGVWRK